MLGETVSRQQYAAWLEGPVVAGDPWLQLPPAQLQARYNRQPFGLQHRLSSHPLMALGELFSLARRLPRPQVAYRFGQVAGDADFDASFYRHREGLTLDDAIDDLEGRRAYLCLSNPERDPLYRPLILSLYAEIARQTRVLDPGITWISGYVFISGQDAVTPYHMDREMNFLLQVHGRKQVMLWDPADETLMSPAQKDALLAYEGARPGYHAAFEPRGERFDLGPGQGVHHPFIAPHRVHTASGVSVSLALTFRTLRSDVWTAAHHFNQHLRHLGWRPLPVGRQAWLDHAKARLLRTARQCAHPPRWHRSPAA